MFEAFVFRGPQGDAPNNSFVLPPGCTEFAVGRQSCDLCLTDPSISRKHSTIRVDESNTLTVSDHSKFGTFVNGERLPPNQPKELYLGDSVQFANHQIRFYVSKEPMKVCTSNLQRYERKLFKDFCLKNGIEIQNDVDESTHLLVMSNITATLKVFASLMLSRLIVTPSFFLTNQATRTHAKIYDYQPPIVEPIVNKALCNLRISPIRTKFFKDLSFLFLDESHFSRMRKVFHFGGAKTVLYLHLSAKEKQSVLDDLKSYIVLAQAESILLQSDLVTLKAKMNDLRMRPITDCEFGLSVLYCNKTDYCNPFKTIPKELEFLSTQALKTKETLGLETVSQVTQKRGIPSGALISSNNTLIETVDNSDVPPQLNMANDGFSYCQAKPASDRNCSDNQIENCLINDPVNIRAKKQNRKEPLLLSKGATNIPRVDDSENIGNKFTNNSSNESATPNKVINSARSGPIGNNKSHEPSNKRSFGAMYEEPQSREVTSKGATDKLKDCHETAAKVARYGLHMAQPKTEPTESSFNMWHEGFRDSNIPDSDMECEQSYPVPCSSRLCDTSESVPKFGGRNLSRQKVKSSGDGWSRKLGNSRVVVSMQTEVKYEPTDETNHEIGNLLEMPTCNQPSCWMQVSFMNLTSATRKSVPWSNLPRSVGNVCSQNFKQFKKILPVLAGKQLAKEDYLPLGNTGPLIRICNQRESGAN